MLKLYSNQGSGNCYKVRLLLEMLGHPFEVVETDVLAGATQTPEFLALNPVGKVPTLVLGPDQVMSESNAILLYFADETQYLPMDIWDRGMCWKWLFWEQYSHEPYIAVARFIMHYLGKTVDEEPRLTELWKKGHVALKVMEDHLAKEEFFAGHRFSIADIALYAYTHVADQGGFDLSPYPHIRSWLDRVASQPRYKSITEI